MQSSTMQLNMTQVTQRYDLTLLVENTNFEIPIIAEVFLIHVVLSVEKV